MNALHVVLGAGQIGPLVARRLASAGHQVRVVRRSAGKRPVAGVEVFVGDICDPAFADRVTTGDAGQRAAVIYDCMNPTYDKWDEELLALGRGSLGAATRSGGRLVALDGLYQYGRPLRDASGTTLPMDEAMAMNPCSRKGELKKQLAELRLGAHRRGEAHVSIGRASDFFGADLPGSFWSERFFRAITRGRAGECFGDPDMPHAYTFVDDVARALVTLGQRTEVDGPDGAVWHLPTLPAISTQALAGKVGRALGVRNAKVKQVPKLVVRGLGLFNSIIRELPEMTYQWEVPFLVDDSRFSGTFGYGATPLDEQIAAVVAWAKPRFPVATSASATA